MRPRYRLIAMLLASVVAGGAVAAQAPAPRAAPSAVPSTSPALLDTIGRRWAALEVERIAMVAHRGLDSQNRDVRQLDTQLAALQALLVEVAPGDAAARARVRGWRTRLLEERLAGAVVSERLARARGLEGGRTVRGLEAEARMLRARLADLATESTNP